MLSEQDKYQNILSQIHELNRQNLLTENERNEHIMNKLSELQFQIQNKQNDINSNSIFSKIQYTVIFLIVMNLILTFFLLFSYLNKNTISNKNNNEIITTKEIIKAESIEIKPITNEKEVDENIVLFNTQEIAEESFQEMKPIIKKDTQYTCEDDNFQTKYKIPYTVEIKGKLYSDKFMFILQNGLDRKNCKIDKNDI
jgi:uncharacterized membrane protein (DUF106 family)